MLKYFRILLYFILIIFLVIWQRSFVTVLPGWLEQLNFLLVALVFVLVLVGTIFARWWALGMGVVMDIYSFTPFGVFTFVFLLTAVLLNFLFHSFFTNRSLYSFLALILLSTLFYETVLALINYFILILGEDIGFFLFCKEFWLDLSQELAINSVATLVIFYIFNFVSNKFRPVFIKK